MIRTICALLGAPILLLSMSGCADSGTSVDDAVVVLDVRTPEEYANGHLEGAQLLDFNSGELTAALPGLATDVAYLVYCRSGNRSEQAKLMMEQAGLANVTNLGSLEDAADATDIPIVS